jgi:hypothetical protein
MKRYYAATALFVVLTLIGTSLQAQDTENRSVGNFKGVKVGQAIDVYLTTGTSTNVRVEVEDGNVSDVETNVSGGMLKIGMKRGNYRNIRVKVYVTHKGLEYISASSASNIYSENTLKSSKMSIDVSSAATAELEVEASEIEAQVSSSGDLELKGSAERAALYASSAGDIDAYDFTTSELKARASSAGGIRARAEDSIDAHASSGGSVRWKGNPSRSRTDSSSGGSVRKSG